jgi:hypothetical protein
LFSLPSLQQGEGNTGGHNDIHFQLDQFYRKVWEPLIPALAKTILYDNVLSLDIAEVPQTLPEGF